MERIPLVKLIPELDVEEVRFSYYFNKARKMHFAQIKYSGLRFIMRIYPDYYYFPQIKSGDVYWRRTGNKVELLRKRKDLSILLGSFTIDRTNWKCICENGEEVPIPQSKKINLRYLVPAMASKDGFEEILCEGENDLLDIFVERTNVEIHKLAEGISMEAAPVLIREIQRIKISDLIVFEQESEDAEPVRRDLSDKYFFALKVLLGRIASNNADVGMEEVLSMFASVAYKFFIDIESKVQEENGVNGSMDIVKIHFEDIAEGIDRLVKIYGWKAVMDEFEVYKNGALWPYVMPVLQFRRDRFEATAGIRL
jgi:hypothetical protein